MFKKKKSYIQIPCFPKNDRHSNHNNNDNNKKKNNINNNDNDNVNIQRDHLIETMRPNMIVVIKVKECV